MNLNPLKIRCKCQYCINVYGSTYIFFWNKTKVERKMSEEMARLKQEYRLGTLDGFKKIHAGKNVPLKAYGTYDEEQLRRYQMLILKKVVENKDMETFHKILDLRKLS